MLKKFKYREVTWIDLESPTGEELGAVGREYGLQPIVRGELEGPTTRAKVDIYSDFIYAVFHFPRGLLGHPTPVIERDYIEIDFIIGKNFLITTHYELVNALNDFSKIFEADFMLKRNHDPLHAGFVFYYIIKEIYRSLELGLGYLNDRLRLVGRDIFAGREKEVVRILADINHELLDSRWALKQHHQLLNSLALAGPEFFGHDFRHHLAVLTGEHDRVWNMIESNHATFLDLRETNDSLLSIKNNEVVKMLTAIAVTFLPLNLIVQVFAVPAANRSLMFSLMAAGFLVTFWVIKKRRWL